MTYFCELCQDYHSSKYYKHLKYKRIEGEKINQEISKDEILLFILEVLDEWSYFVQRKHNTWRRNEEFIKKMEKYIEILKLIKK